MKHPIGSFRRTTVDRTVRDPEIGKVTIPAGFPVKVTGFAGPHSTDLAVVTMGEGMRHYGFNVKPEELA